MFTRVFAISAEMARLTEVRKLAGRKEHTTGHITKLSASLQTNWPNLDWECDYLDVAKHRTIINIIVNHEFKLWYVKVRSSCTETYCLRIVSGNVMNIFLSNNQWPCPSVYVCFDRIDRLQSTTHTAEFLLNQSFYMSDNTVYNV